MDKRNKYLERVRYHLQQKKLIKNTEAYSEPSHTCKMELFAKMVNGFHLLTVFHKASS